MSDASHAPAKGGSGGDALMKAVGVGFLVLIFVNGNLSTGMQWAIIAGAIAYFVITKKPAGGAH